MTVKRPESNPATSANFNSYFLELERLLGRIAQSATHYQVLGVETTATREQIISAYHQMLHQLFPSYQLAATLPPVMRQRMDQAFERATRAFHSLGDGRRRDEYDDLLQQTPLTGTAHARTPDVPVIAPPPVATLPPPALPPQTTRPVVGTDMGQSGTLIVNQQFRHGEVYSLSKTDGASNRRRCDRMTMKLPVRVNGFEQNGSKWHEMSESVDVSRTGIRILMRRRVRHNIIVHLNLPLPLKLRSHGFHESSYSVYAIVRRIFPMENGVRAIGLEFIGEHPPSGWLAKPWAVCRTREWKGINRRRHPRFDRAEAVALEFLDEDRKVVGREKGTTENISRSGVRVGIHAMPPEFDLVRIAAPGSDFISLAVVTNSWTGKDRKIRICLQFIEREWPISA